MSRRQAAERTASWLAEQAQLKLEPGATAPPQRPDYAPSEVEDYRTETLLVFDRPGSSGQGGRLSRAVRRLRFALKHARGRTYVDLRVEEHRERWVTTERGFTLDPAQLDAVIEALQVAREKLKAGW